MGARVPGVAARKPLQNKPVRELTDEEVLTFGKKSPDYGDMSKLVRWIVKEYIKQSEPNEIPSDQAKLDEGGWEVKFQHIGGETAGSDRINSNLVRSNERLF